MKLANRKKAAGDMKFSPTHTVATPQMGRIFRDFCRKQPFSFASLEILLRFLAKTLVFEAENGNRLYILLYLYIYRHIAIQRWKKAYFERELYEIRKGWFSRQKPQTV